MPRVRYAGNFAVEQIPAITPAIRGSADVQSLRGGAGQPKRWRFTPGARSTPSPAPPISARRRCARSPPAMASSRAKGRVGPAHLYAVADQVVLTRRLREPLTPAIAAVTPPIIARPPAPASNDDAALRESLIQRLASINLKMTSEDLKTSVTRYLALTAVHRAMAATGSSIGVGVQPTLIAAETMALEKCQVLEGSPCALVSSDREVAPASPLPGSKWSVRDMPEASYNGYFDAAHIPGVDDTVRKRPDVAGYYRAPIPKAAAIGVGGCSSSPKPRANSKRNRRRSPRAELVVGFMPREIRSCCDNGGRRRAPGWVDGGRDLLSAGQRPGANVSAEYSK